MTKTLTFAFPVDKNRPAFYILLWAMSCQFSFTQQEGEADTGSQNRLLHSSSSFVSTINKSLIVVKGFLSHVETSGKANPHLS